MQENWVAKHVGKDPYVEQLKSHFDKPYHVGPTGRMVNNHAEISIANVGDYLDAWLTAKTNVQVFDFPGGAVKAVFYPGDILGLVYSYKIHSGNIWLQLDTPDGKHFGWVRQTKGAFETTGGWGEEDAKFRKQQEEREKANNPLTPLGDVVDGVKALGTGIGDTLKGFGGNLSLIIGLAIAGIVVYTFFYAKKSLAF